MVYQARLIFVFVLMVASPAFGLAADHVNWLQTQAPLFRKSRARRVRSRTTQAAAMHA